MNQMGLRQRTLSRSTSPPANYSFHTFISYTTREDEVRQIKPTIDRFVEHIKNRGITVSPIYYDAWYLERRRYAHDELAGRLRSAIADSAFTTAFLSPGYIQSSWCRFEWYTTAAIHSARDSPAPGHSLFPILWKPLPGLALLKPRQDMLRSAKDRMNLEYPGIPTKGRAVDISHADLRDRWGGAPMALWHVFSAMSDYLDAWYPENEVTLLDRG